MAAIGFRVEVAKWLSLVRLLMGEVPEHSEFTAPGLAAPLAAYFGIAQAVRAGDLTAFRCAALLIALIAARLQGACLCTLVQAGVLGVLLIVDAVSFVISHPVVVDVRLSANCFAVGSQTG